LLNLLLQIANKLRLPAKEKCLPSRCLATKVGINFAKPLPGTDRTDTRTDTQNDGKDL
jgi:hypothetical protein